MASVAPVCSIGIMEFLLESHKKQGNVLGDTMMLMAHDILRAPIRHKNLVMNAFEHGIKRVIVDNSLVEVLDGTTPAITFEQVLEAGRIVEATYTIMPDVMGDANETSEAIQKAYDKQPKPFVGEYAYVIQGKNVLEHMALAAGCVMGYNAKMLCVPRVITNTMGSRYPTLRTLGAEVRNSYEIHLLGCSKKVEDDFTMCRMFQNIVSIDSANPVVAALNDSPNILTHMQRPKDFFDISPNDLTINVRNLIISNVATAQQEVQGHDVSRY